MLRFIIPLLFGCGMICLNFFGYFGVESIPVESIVEVVSNVENELVDTAIIREAVLEAEQRDVYFKNVELVSHYWRI